LFELSLAFFTGGNGFFFKDLAGFLAAGFLAGAFAFLAGFLGAALAFLGEGFFAFFAAFFAICMLLNPGQPSVFIRGEK
jgi:hypothetical protein